MIFITYTDAEAREAVLNDLDMAPDDSDWTNTIAALSDEIHTFRLDNGRIVHQLDISDTEEHWLREYLDGLVQEEIIAEGSVAINYDIPSELYTAL